ncbi:MAG: MBL fold metallo-hydrolase [Anaerolineae bacterium]|nr:MBL fold metallo-hydrolase [Anaerolineae bacterium]
MAHPRVVPIRLGFVKAFLLLGQRPILVDCGLPGSAPRIVKALEAHGLRPEDLALLLITHAHTDHFGSAAALKEAAGVPVAVGRADAEALRQGRNPAGTPRNALLGFLQRLGGRAGGAPPCEPDILLEGDADLQPYGVDGQVLATPGHTPGSVSVLLADGQAVVGDLVMGGLLGRGKPSLPLLWDDLDAHRASLQRLLEAGPTRIHTSHGGPFHPDEVRAFLLPGADAA